MACTRDLLRRGSLTPVQPQPLQALGGQLRRPSGPADVKRRRETSSPPARMLQSLTMHSLDPKPFRPFKSKSEYVEAMKEDLAEWLTRLYPDLLHLTADNFFEQLETGAIVCRHANSVTQMGQTLAMTEKQEERTLDRHHHQTPPSECANSIAREPNNNVSAHSIGHLGSGGGSGGGSVSESPSLTDSSMSSVRSSTRKLSETFNTVLSLGTPKAADRAAIDWFRIKKVPFKRDAVAGTFFARDNICQFINWCRSLNILECLLFETDDLVARKNERSVILCLLEVARIGFKVGMPTPLIIQLEQEIEQEIENEAKLREQLEQKWDQHSPDETTALASSKQAAGYACEDAEEDEAISSYADQEETSEHKKDSLLGEVSNEQPSPDLRQENESEEEDLGPKPQVITNDLLSLHERVVQLLCQCTCPTQFPMERIGDNGKYKVGDKLIIFVRILRRHIMVRVGGGWQELSEFLRLKDPCRSKSFHQQTPMSQHQHQHQHQQQVYGNGTSKLAPMSLVVRSRLNESSQNPNRGHPHNQHSPHTYRGAGGQRVISGSASMSWLSHNS